MSFWLRYILILIIGTMTVYWGAPALLAHLKPSVPGPHATSAPGTPDYGTTATPAPASATADAPITPAAPRPSIRRPPDADGTTVPAAPPAAAPAATPVPTAAVTAPPAKVVLDYTPSTTRIPSSGDDVTHWGMAIHLAPFFTKTGKRMDRLLPGGTLIEQITTTVSPDGEFSVCRLWDGKAWSEPFLVSTADLIRFPGGRDEVDADELEILARYHALHADMAARRVELTRAAVDANPHAAPLRELKQRYDAAAAHAARLTKTRDSAKEAARSSAGDELRRLKEDEARMRREITALTRHYEQWKQSNAPAAADPGSDPRIQELTSQMETLRPRLRNFGL